MAGVGRFHRNAARTVKAAGPITDCHAFDADFCDASDMLGSVKLRLGIRTRAVLWLALLAALMAAVLYPAGTRWLDRNFREFEKAQIEKDSDRVRLASPREPGRRSGS